MAKYNIIAKCARGREYFMTDMHATTMSEKAWQNKREAWGKVGEFIDTDEYVWRFIPHKDTDFSWWGKVSKKLTPTRIKKAYFECDYYGNVREDGE